MITKYIRLKNISALSCAISIHGYAVFASFKYCSNATSDTGVRHRSCTKQTKYPSTVPENLENGRSFSSEHANVK